MSQCIALQAYLSTGTKGTSIPVIIALTRCRSGITRRSCSVIGYRIGALMDTESQTRVAFLRSTVRQSPGEEARHRTQMVGPLVSTNSYCTHASYDSEFKVFISSQVSFSVADIWPATSTYPAVSNLMWPRRHSSVFCPIPKNNILCSLK
jgi:hypothetical protein